MDSSLHSSSSLHLSKLLSLRVGPAQRGSAPAQPHAQLLMLLLQCGFIFGAQSLPRYSYCGTDLPTAIGASKEPALARAYPRPWQLWSILLPCGLIYRSPSLWLELTLAFQPVQCSSSTGTLVMPPSPASPGASPWPFPGTAEGGDHHLGTTAAPRAQSSH